MLKITLCVGIPASGKSTWSKEEVAKAPEGIIRINRDDLRNMMSNYHFSDLNEKLVTSAKHFMIQQALRYGRDIIIDETNLNRRNFDDICKLVRDMNLDCMVLEKSFYIELEEAIERDSKREGTAKVGEEVVRKFWKKAGGNLHKHYKPRVEIFNKNQNNEVSNFLRQDQSLPKAAIFDLDGTMCNISHRNPYDASTCELDSPNEHVVSLAKLFYSQGIKILFFSGREDKYEKQTINWLNNYFGEDYSLDMRKSQDFRKDSIIKKELYESEALNKFNIIAIVDDRLQVCELWHSLGLPLFRVGNPNANF